jgi:hypothetical protein
VGHFSLDHTPVGDGRAVRQLVPSVRSRVLAERAFLAVIRCQAASSHVLSGIRVLSRLVLLVTDVCWRQAGHTNRLRVWRHRSAVVPHAGQKRPLDQRKLLEVGGARLVVEEHFPELTV